MKKLLYLAMAALVIYVAIMTFNAVTYNPDEVANNAFWQGYRDEMLRQADGLTRATKRGDSTCTLSGGCSEHAERSQSYLL